LQVAYTWPISAITMNELAQALLQPGAQITLAVLAGSVFLFIGGWLAAQP
jgi:hypothetical protein